MPGRHGRAGESSTRCWPQSVAEAAQLTVDAAVAPGRVLPCQPQHQSPNLRRHGGTATPVWVGPAAPNQILMPAQQRRRLYEHPAPDRARQQPGEPGQHRAVSPVHPGSDHLPAEHRNLVPQHQQLHVLGRRAPRQQHQPSHQLAEDQIQQSKRHPSIICVNDSPSELAAQSLRPTFRHPQAALGANPRSGSSSPQAAVLAVRDCEVVPRIFTARLACPAALPEERTPGIR